MRVGRGAPARAPGFSLVEVLIAVYILATAFLTVLQLFPTNSQSQRQSKGYLLATHVCREKLEEEVYQPFASIGTHPPAGGPPPSAAWVPVSVNTMTNGSSSTLTFFYRIDVRQDDQVTPVPVAVPAGANRLKEVQCTVEWFDGAHNAAGQQMLRNITMTSRVSNP